jgi:hypothetical protein
MVLSCLFTFAGNIIIISMILYVFFPESTRINPPHPHVMYDYTNVMSGGQHVSHHTGIFVLGFENYIAVM